MYEIEVHLNYKLWEVIGEAPSDESCDDLTHELHILLWIDLDEELSNELDTELSNEFKSIANVRD